MDRQVDRLDSAGVGQLRDDSGQHPPAKLFSCWRERHADDFHPLAAQHRSEWLVGVLEHGGVIQFVDDGADNLTDGPEVKDHPTLIWLPGEGNDCPVRMSV